MNKNSTAWVWTAIDQDSRLIVSWRVGRRDQATAKSFLLDLRSRCESGFQFITDGCFVYPRVVEEVFPETGVQHIVLNTSNARDMRYSGSAHRADGWTTNHVERLNGDMRARLAAMRRHSRTVARSDETLSESLSIYVVHYNFVRVQRGHTGTPAMRDGLATAPWSVHDIIDRLEATEPKIERRPVWLDAVKESA